MAYCVLADITARLTLERLVELIDDDNDGTPTEAELGYVADAIEEADRLIDSYLGQKYTVPFTAVPARIAQLSSILAIGFLWRRRVQRDPMWNQQFDAAIAELKDYASGERLLPGATPSDSGPRSTTENAEPIFKTGHVDADGETLDDGTMDIW
jgi:phage gp36-like protein